MIVAGFEKFKPPVPKSMMRTYGDKSDVTVLKPGNKLSFKCRCGCEFVVSQRYCETELTGEFSFACPECKRSFACPECKRKCLHD